MRLWKFILFTSVLASLLTGCLIEQDPCEYYHLTQKTMRENHWNVDTLKVFVYDSVNLYQLDTAYIDDGEIQFVPDEINACNDSGTMLFKRTNGQVVSFRYSFASLGSLVRNDYIYLQTDTPVDGFNEVYKRWSFFNLAGGTIKITEIGNTQFNSGYYYMNRVAKLQRYWTFTLTKK